MPPACLALAALALACLSFTPSLRTDPPWPNVNPTTAPIGLTTGDVARLAREPGGEATLANSLLPHIGNAAPTDALLLAASHPERMQSSSRFAGWPPGSLIISRIEPVASPFREPVLRQVIARDGWIRLELTDARAPAARRSIAISLTGLFEVGALLMLAWLLAGWGLRTYMLIRRHREQRRIANALCARCGYPVGTAALPRECTSATQRGTTPLL